MENLNQPFGLLPEALVEEMLAKTESIGEFLSSTLKEINEKKPLFRNQLIRKGWLKKDNDLPRTDTPTSCAVDGSYVVEKLMAVDLVACAAISIEGFTPPKEDRFWDKPRHLVEIFAEKHNPDYSTIIRGLMWEMEIILAGEPPHDVVFIDGSLTNPIISLNASLNALEKLKQPKSEIIKKIESLFLDFLQAYKRIVENRRSDKLWVGIPKYTSKKEIGDELGWDNSYDDRAILTSILQAGEYTELVPYQQPEQEWHINMKKLSNYVEGFETIWEEIKAAIYRLHVLYYKPYSYTPTLRIEVPQALKSNQYQLAMLLAAIKFQFGTAGIMEPYPLFMADKMVKSLAGAIPTFRQVATKKMAENFEADLSEVYFSMHSYRTE